MAAPRKRIGFFVNHIGWEGHYTNTLWRSAAEHCRLRGFDLLLFTGPQSLDDYVAQQVQSAVFRLVDPRRLDGLILSSGIRYLGKPGWQLEFVHEFSHIPMVCVAQTIPGVPSVLVDNFAGMQSMVEHLIQVHGHRQQAFIRGPLDAEDANIRFDAWIKTLAGHGIAFDPEIVLMGNFVAVEHPERLIEAWKAGRRFGAVVAASDLMALDMIAAFRSAGIRVPEDVAVVGFDDDPQNRYAASPLSSVYQPIHEQTSAAIDLLADQWAGRPVPSLTSLPTMARIRASCGCARASWSVDPRLRSNILQAAAHPVTFGETLTRLVAQAENSADCTFDLLTAIDALQREDSWAGIGIAEVELDRIRTRLYAKALADLRLLTKQALPVSVRALETVQATATAATLDTVNQVLSTNLPDLGIEKYCFSVVPALLMDESMVSTTNSTAVFYPVAHRPSQPPLAPNGAFTTSLLAPDGWFNGLEQSAMVILPIASRTTWYGLFVCELIPGQESLVLQLQGALVLACDREYQAQRSKRQSLSEWGRKLLQNSGVQNIASLVRGVAHEMNTPLGNCVTIASSLQDTLLQVEKDFAAGTLGRQTMVNFFATGREGTDILTRNLDRMTHLVKTFKKVSISEYDSQHEHFDLHGEVVAVAGLLQNELKARFITIDLPAGAPGTVVASRSAIREVISCLIQNSMDHAFSQQMHAKPCIRVSIEQREDDRSTVLRVSDNGCGIAHNVRHQIFDAFYTTKRFEGHVGLGLAIAHGIVVDGLGGSIAYVPNTEAGGLFEIRLPGPEVPRTGSQKATSANLQQSSNVMRSD